MIEIDGSMGEGGGQILRTALALSCVTGKAFRVFRIRNSRPKPGLMPQHLMAVKAAQQVAGATVTGDSQGAREVEFAPAQANPGRYYFDIQTAGAATLLLQALVLPLSRVEGPSLVEIRGGTHVPFSPPAEHMQHVLLPILSTLGVNVRLDVQRPGFYPKGGGRLTAYVTPSIPSPLAGEGRERGSPCLQCTSDAVGSGGGRTVAGVSVVSNLPEHIAVRQRESAVAVLKAAGLNGHIEVRAIESLSAGTYIFLKLEGGPFPAGFSALGERGVTAEKVGADAAQALVRHMSTGMCLDPHVADQVVPFLGMADGPSEFTTSRISNHLLTNLSVLAMFLDVSHHVDGEVGAPGKVTIVPGSAPRTKAQEAEHPPRE